MNGGICHTFSFSPSFEQLYFFFFHRKLFYNFTIEIENDCRIRIRIFSRVEFALLHNFSMREKYSSVSSDLVDANACEEMFKIFGT